MIRLFMAVHPPFQAITTTKVADTAGNLGIRRRFAASHRP
jgi:hypothetical protein